MEAERRAACVKRRKKAMEKFLKKARKSLGVDGASSSSDDSGDESDTTSASGKKPKKKKKKKKKPKKTPPKTLTYGAATKDDVGTAAYKALAKKNPGRTCKSAGRTKIMVTHITKHCLKGKK